MRRLGRASFGFIVLTSLATCVACGSKTDANDPKLSAAASASGPAPAASGPLAKLEGSRTDVQDGAKEIAESGDDATKRAAAPILVKRIRAMREAEYREELRPLVVKANEAAKLEPT